MTDTALKQFVINVGTKKQIEDEYDAGRITNDMFSIATDAIPCILSEIAQAGDGITFTGGNTYVTNYTVSGNPTIDSDYIASGFSTNSYLTFQNPLSTFDDFEYNICITTPSSWSASFNPMTLGINAEDYIGFMIMFGTGLTPTYNAGKMSLVVQNVQGSSWTEIANMPYEFSTNTKYYIKISYNNGTWTISYSTDGTSYTQIGTVSQTLTSLPNTMVIGNSPDCWDGQYPFKGSIHLKDTYLVSNNTEVWRAVAPNNPITTISADVDQVYSGISTNAQSGIAVKSAIDSAISSVYKPAGSIAFSARPTPAATYEGYVYNINEEFTTDNTFVEGSGKTYPAGTNIVCINTATSGTAIYKWDVLSGLVDLTNYLQNTATGSNSISISNNPTSANYAINIGNASKAAINSIAYGYAAEAGTGGTAIGRSAKATGLAAVAVGYAPTATKGGSIMLGNGTNTEENTFKVALTSAQAPATNEASGLFTLLTAEGKVPTGRYIPFTGADGTDPGTTGAVPAPTATDNNKFLKGDGTWATVSGSGTPTQKVTVNNPALTSENDKCEWVITHNLNTKDVIVSVYNLTTNEEPLYNVEHTSVNTITVTFNSSTNIAANSYRAVIMGSVELYTVLGAVPGTNGVYIPMLTVNNGVQTVTWTEYTPVAPVSELPAEPEENTVYVVTGEEESQ